MQHSGGMRSIILNMPSSDDVSEVDRSVLGKAKKMKRHGSKESGGTNKKNNGGEENGDKRKGEKVQERRKV